MALKLTLNPITGQLDLVQNLSAYAKTTDLTAYAKLDGTNQPFTGDVEIVSGLNSKLTINGQGTDVVYGTGGDTVTDIVVGSDNYRVHKFTTVGAGTFVAPSEDVTVEVLVVAGGGSGGSDASGGGGGGVLVGTLALTASESISLSVGASDTDSVFKTLTAIKGGTNGGAGGCGAGRSRQSAGAGGAGTSGQGYAGGSCDGGPNAGGGGGAGAVGGNGVSQLSGSGGNGKISSITGVATYYGGGGGAGSRFNAPPGRPGGLGGGGAGGWYYNVGGTKGTDGLGGGGGGIWDSPTPPKGGSGVVIVRYIPPTSTKTAPKIVLEGSGTQTAAIYTDPFDSDKFKIDVASTTALEIDPSDQSAIFSGDVTVTGDVVASTGFYIGDETTDGSWRLVPDGTSLKVQRLESATWVDKGEFTA